MMKTMKIIGNYVLVMYNSDNNNKEVKRKSRCNQSA